jgi:hypothetical protein
MNSSYLVYSLLGVALGAILLSMPTEKSEKHPGKTGFLSSYLLANSNLNQGSVISLLMSSSFGLNSLFYAAWLGYAIGVWALVIQFAWTVSFWLLARYTTSIGKHKSLHHLLGESFGSRTRLVAGLCSMLGMMIFIGWEVAITNSAFSSMLAPTTATTGVTLSSIMTFGVIAVCIFYTIYGGLRGNARADLGLNIVKTLCCIAITIAIGVIAIGSDTFSWKDALFPSSASFALIGGIFGFITSVIFNISWQFVDASSWHSIIAGKDAGEEAGRRNIIRSGNAIFILPGVLGTVLGICMHVVANVTPDNIVSLAGSASALLVPVLAIVSFVMIIACVMSLLDGMFLTSAYILTIDTFYPNHTLPQLDTDPVKATKILFLLRLALVVIGLAGSFGVAKALQLFGGNIFSFVYVVVISQLSLLGPVLAALTSRKTRDLGMWVVILVSLGTGFGSVYYGTITSTQWLVDFSGTITALISCVLAFGNSRAAEDMGVNK